ncbi:hypothetical protein [Streptomyces griseoluteus]|uniref:hypothetical protein n=1 Tax=Streptomyces griseoluteus TaxID=29306 RepID=UPI003319E5F5
MSEGQQLGGEALKGMRPETIVAALEAGQLTEYLAGEPTAAAPVAEVEQYGGEWLKGRDPAEVTAAVRAGHLRAYLTGEIP